MSSNLVGLAILAYGLFQLFQNGATPQDITFWLTNVGSVLGGTGYLAYNNASAAVSMFKKSSVPVVEANNCFAPEAFNARDNECLFHLNQRCVLAKSSEGISVCSQLAAIMFSLDLPKEEKVNAKTIN